MGFHLFLSYREELSPLEVEIGLAFRAGWCCREADASQFSTKFSKTPIEAGCLDCLVLLRNKVRLVFYTIKLTIFLGLDLVVLSRWFV